MTKDELLEKMKQEEKEVSCGCNHCNGMALEMQEIVRRADVTKEK